MKKVFLVFTKKDIPGILSILCLVAIPKGHFLPFFESVIYKTHKGLGKIPSNLSILKFKNASLRVYYVDPQMEVTFQLMG